MDPAKVKEVQEWHTPKKVKDVQAFLGFANFYRRFILGFLKVENPLTQITRKGHIFECNPEAQIALNTLKNAFTTAPILAHFDPDNEMLVETDASDSDSACILSQLDINNVLRPVAYMSKKHSPTECNYAISDKEPFASISAFEKWRPELDVAAHPIAVLSDHKNLAYFINTKQLNWQQARWSEYLSQFTFTITYRPGKQGAKPKALTRRSGDLYEEWDERLLHQSQTVLKTENLDLELNSLAKLKSRPVVK